MTEQEIEQCRVAVMSAYLWVARMNSTDQAKNAKIGHLRIEMENVLDRFEELFP